MTISKHGTRRARAALLALVLAAAGAAGAQDDRPEGPFVAFAGAWRVVEVDGAPLPRGVTVTLEIAADGAISGSGGCNRYSGRMEAGAGLAVTLGPVAVTRMACPEPQMDAEDRYMAALTGVAQAGIAGDGRLALVAGDRVQVVAEPSDAAE